MRAFLMYPDCPFGVHVDKSRTQRKIPVAFNRGQKIASLRKCSAWKGRQDIAQKINYQYITGST